MSAAVGWVTVAMWLLPALAPAAEPQTHALLFTLRSEVKEKELIPPPEGEFEDACGVAVDPQGDVYVSDYYHRRVDVYGPAPAHTYLTQLADPAPDGPCNLAIDAAGRIYINHWRGDVVRFTPSEYPPTKATRYGSPAPVDPGPATGLALDPAAGDLYVDEGTDVAVYEAAQLSQPEPQPGRMIGLDPLASYYGIAVSGFPATTGDLYLADAATDSVRVFGPAGNLEGEIDGAGAPQGFFTDLTDSNLAIDQTNGHLYLADDTEPFATHPVAVVYEFNPAGAYRGRLSGILDAQPTALAVDGAGDLYVTSGNDENALLDVFGPTFTAHGLAVAATGSGQGRVISEPAGIDCPGACSAELNAGEEVILTAAPAVDSAFVGWNVAGKPTACTGLARCRLTLSADAEVSASFEALPQGTLTVTKAGTGGGTVASLPKGIACAAACTNESAEFEAGSKVRLTATPAPASAFLGWSGACSGTGTCEVTISAAQAVGAEFEAIPQHTLTVQLAGAGTVQSAPPGIQCGEKSCAAEFNAGAAITLTATPKPGSLFSGWSGGGCSGTGPCEVTLAADTILSAGFAPIQDALTLTTTGSGQGSVASVPSGVACGASCTHLYDQGTALTLTAVPAPGSRFAGWSGGGCSGRQTCQLTVGQDTELSAAFAIIHHTLAVLRTGAGQGTLSSVPSGIACGPDCAAVYPQGTTLTLTAHPRPGSTFAGWSGCDSPSGERCTLALGSERTLSANFAPRPTKHRHRRAHRHHHGGKR